MREVTSPMTLERILRRALLLVVLVLAANGESQPRANGATPSFGERDLDEPTATELVAALAYEGPAAKTATLQSNLNHFYDTTIEQMLVNPSAELVALLIDRLNDPTQVRYSTGENSWPCKYDTPIRVKNKVRFVLGKLLVPADLRRIVPDLDLDAVDVDRARSAWSAQREEVSARLRRIVIPPWMDDEPDNGVHK